jgi:hypothetical protein
MGSLVDSFAQLAAPWADLYGDSLSLQVLIMFAHFAGLLVAGGLAFSADSAVRRERGGWENRIAVTRSVASSHRMVIGGLVAVVISGVMLLAADVEALLPSPVFWMKMGAFALLLGNGVLLQRAERDVAAVGTMPVDSPEGEVEAEPVLSAGSRIAELPAAPTRMLPADAEARWRRLRGAALRSGALWFAVLFLGTVLTLAA